MAYSKEAAAAQFDRWSRSYDRSILQRIFFAPAHRLLLEHLPVNGQKQRHGRPLRVLDVGCGTGTLAARMQNQDLACRFFGVDLCRPMLAQARQRALPAHRFAWVQADSERLAFDDHSFDLVVCIHSLHHYPHQARAIKEMHRVLAPGGTAIIIDGYRDRPWGRLLYDVLVVAVEGQVHHPSARQFQEWFSQAGFGRLQQQTLSGLTPMLLTKGIALCNGG